MQTINQALSQEFNRLADAYSASNLKLKKSFPAMAYISIGLAVQYRQIAKKISAKDEDVSQEFYEQLYTTLAAAEQAINSFENPTQENEQELFVVLSGSGFFNDLNNFSREDLMIFVVTYDKLLESDKIKAAMGSELAANIEAKLKEILEYLAKFD